MAHSCLHRYALQLAQEDIEHRLARDKQGRAQRDGQRIARSVIVAVHRPRTGSSAWAGRGRRTRRRCATGGSAWRRRPRPRDKRLLDGSVEGVLERHGRETLVVIDGAVADKLDLGDERDSLELCMKNFAVDWVLLLA